MLYTSMIGNDFRCECYRAHGLAQQTSLSSTGVSIIPGQTFKLEYDTKVIKFTFLHLVSKIGSKDRPTCS